MNDEQFREVSDIKKVAFDAFVTGDTSSAIERQEKRAQQSMVGGARLPKSIDGPYGRTATWEKVCEAWGMTIDGEVDDLFNRATLPAGWQIVATDHSMWTSLVDDRGRTRANIFYKGAFYDRSAFVSLTKRYFWSMDYDSDKPNRIVQVFDRGQGAGAPVIIHNVGKVIRANEKDYSRAVLNAEEELGRQAQAWLNEKFPEHENVLAYW